MSYFPNMPLIYLFEAVIEEIRIGDATRTDYDDLKISIECKNLIKTVIEKNQSRRMEKVDLRIKENEFNAGKTFFFCATTTEVQEIFQSQIHMDVFQKSTNDKLGTAFLTWREDFGQQVVQLSESNAQPIHFSNEYEILNNGKGVGIMIVHLHLNCFGRFIEENYRLDTSYFTVPKFGRTPEKSDEDVPWRSLFVASNQEKVSIIDPEMKIFAQMAGVRIPPSEFKKLTSEYINSKLCKTKNCPGAKKFKEYGIGPLASRGAAMTTTIQSLKFAKPAISQAYGTLSNYGPYGLFAEPVKHPKTYCESPDCPYKALHQIDARERQRLKSIKNKNAKKNNNCCCAKCLESDSPKDIPCPFLKKKKKSNGEGACSCSANK